MLKETDIPNLYIICDTTDMRKGLKGLLEIVTAKYKLDPYSDSLFLFCGRNKRKIKALCWEGDGFLLMSKSLNSMDSKYKWPKNSEEAKLLTREQFTWLMQGLAIEQPKAIKTTNVKYDLY